MASWPACALRPRRSGAGEAVCAAAGERHKQARAGLPSAATCQRRNVRASSVRPGFSGQARTAANPRLVNSCSMHQAASAAGWRISRRSRAIPAAAQAGAYGRKGGATRANQPPLAERRAKAGMSRLNSPMPLLALRNSLKQARGQPPPGNSASSSAKPLGTAAWGKWARLSPRQISPRASTSARAAGSGCLLMRKC